MTTVALNGSCLCGSVRFELIGRITRFYTCHCGRCRKATGSAHAANIFISDDTLEWLTGLEHRREFSLATAQSFNGAFCSICGSPLPRRARSGEFIIVPAGCLDSAPSLASDGAIFWNERASWFEDACDAPRFEGYDVPIKPSGVGGES